MEDGEIVPAFNLAGFVQYYHFNWADTPVWGDGGIGEHAQRAQNYFAIKQLPACFDGGLLEPI